MENDTLYRYRNKINADLNEYEVLNIEGEIKEKLNKLMENVIISSPKPLYEPNDYLARLDWGIVMNDGKRITETCVMANSNPDNLDTLYRFMMQLDDYMDKVPKSTNKTFWTIGILNISKLNSKKPLFNKVNKVRASFLVWKDLANSKESDFYKLEDIEDFTYQVKFWILADESRVSVEKILLHSKGDCLAIKFKDSTEYVGFKLSHNPLINKID